MAATGKDIATLTNVELITEISRLISTLESLQRENEELRRDLSHEASHRQNLQNALAYWMPGVTEEIEISTNGRCGDDALLLVGSEGPFEDKCWGNEILDRAEAAEAEVKRLTESRNGYKRGRDSIQSEYDRLRASHSAEVEALNDKIDGLSADLDSAVDVAFSRGAHEWVRMNYPDRFEKLSHTALASTGGEHHAE